MTNFASITTAVGTKLELSGWRQGSVVKKQDTCLFCEEHNENAILIVASQSCDIAQNNLEIEPFVEFSIGRVISSIQGEFSYSKNPRKLHLEILKKTEDLLIFDKKFIEIIAYKKISIEKERLVDLLPSDTQLLVDDQLKSYSHWLASRYSRPALPTQFNDLLKNADKKDGQKKMAKKISQFLSGIYVEIIPDAEINENQKYRVNLLGLTPTELNTTQQTQVEESIQTYAEIMELAGMDVKWSVMQENEASIAMMKRFKRFYYDDLSLRNDHSLPFESQL